MVRALNLALAAMIFGGCAAKFEYPNLNKFSDKAYEIASDGASNTLYVSHGDEGYLFTLISALGSPLARRKLNLNAEFENIGFLPPKPVYNELFIRVLNMIKDGKDSAMFALGDQNFKVRRLDIR